MANGIAVIVEGKTDKYFLEYFCKAVGIECPEVIVLEGYSNILNFDNLDAEIKRTDIDVLGIILDANDELRPRWNKLSEILLNFDISLPHNPNSKGIIARSVGEAPHIGVWIMPNNDESGELEDFIAEMIDSNDPAWNKASGFLNDFRDQEHVPGKFIKYIRKSIIEALLKTNEQNYAESKKPFVPPGGERVFHWLNYTANCDKFKTWLENMLSLSASP